jgi:hypothetical protein
VIKFPRDGNLRRIFREFALTWKAFLRGLSPPPILVGPFLLRPTVYTLLGDLSPEEIVELTLKIIKAVEKLSRARVEHRELRHPEKHIGIWQGKIVFLDFDHARLTDRSRDLNKFRAWLEGIRRALSRAGR